jgi:hypothetical protein
LKRTKGACSKTIGDAFCAVFHAAKDYERESTERRTYEILMTALSERLTDSEIKALAAEGAFLTEDQAADEALAV